MAEGWFGGFWRENERKLNIQLGWVTWTNLVANPLVPNLNMWGIRSFGNEDWTTVAGAGPDGGYAMRIVRDTDGSGAQTIYVETNPGVASNGLNAPDVSAQVGKWIVSSFRARAESVARQANCFYVFNNAAGGIITTAGGGMLTLPVTADPDGAVRIWFATQIPAGTVTAEIRYQAPILAAEGEVFYASEFMLWVQDTQPLSEADLPDFWPTSAQLESGEAGWSDTAHESTSFLNLENVWSSGFLRSSEYKLSVTEDIEDATWQAGFLRNPEGALVIVNFAEMDAEEKESIGWKGGFLRDQNGALVITTLEGENPRWSSGFLRDENGRLIII